MVRVLSLLWTLLSSVGVTALSFYYVSETAAEVRHGFPFSYARETVNSFGEEVVRFNYVSIIIDVVIWWVLFSLIWLIIKNYVLELD